MIRDYKDGDWAAVKLLHQKAGLPENCLADATDPLFIIRRVLTNPDGRVIMAAFVRITSEPFLLLDHDAHDPETRFRLLRALTDDVCKVARERGLQQLTCFVPPGIEHSFSKRLLELGFVRSPWQSYTKNL